MSRTLRIKDREPTEEEEEEYDEKKRRRGERNLKQMFKRVAIIIVDYVTIVFYAYHRI